MFMSRFRPFRKSFLLLTLILSFLNLAKGQKTIVSVSYHPPLFSANKEAWKNIQMQGAVLSLGYDMSFLRGGVGLEYYILDHTISSNSSEYILLGVSLAMRPLVSFYTRYQPIIEMGFYRGLWDIQKEKTSKSLSMPKKVGGAIGLEVYLTDRLCIVPKLQFYQLSYDIPSNKRGITYSYFNSAISLQYTL